MNNYCRELKLPFEIKKPELFNTQPDHVVHMPLENHYDLNMVKFFKDCGLELLLIECFYTPPNGGKVPIHTDFWWWETDYIKVNQTWGPADGEIVWWDCPTSYEVFLEPGDYVEHNGEEISHHSKSRILTANEEESKKLFSANTNNPSLVNTGIMHSTINPSNEPRWTVCFIPIYDKLLPESYVSWNDAERIFKDYLK
jgi:hypothetical protein|tara:strand:+ start:444 stop:1037 length:594 start_codon:yes stop_codon:yes gene_type:complete